MAKSNTIILVILIIAGILLISRANLGLFALSGTGNYISKWDLYYANDWPQGITTDGNYIYVVDYDDDKIYKYDMSGTYQSKISLSGAPGIDPDGLTIYGSYFWISDDDVDEVLKYNMNGNEVSHFDTEASGNKNPRGITTDGDYIYVVDEITDYVYKYSMVGNYQSKWHLSSTNWDSLGIATNGNYFWVVDYQTKVYQYDMDGNYIRFWDTEECGKPTGITYHGGFIWIVNSDGHDSAICKYDVGHPTELSFKLLLGPNQLVVMESFSGGSTISKTSTRYPVILWGGEILPAIVIDASDNSVSTSEAIYDQLEAGTIQVPYNQVYSLFYVIENNYQLPTICNVVDVDTGLCAQVNPGIVTACSEGQFDPSLGLCVVQPESIAICPAGGYFDVVQAVCIFHPPLQAVCEQGIYNVNTEMCEYYPDEEYVCDYGFVYNSNIGKCVAYPLHQINCPGGYAYDAVIDKCVRYPVEQIICPTGTTYNFNTDRCEYTPPSAYVCQIGFTYNSFTGKCELRPAEQIICGVGTYNEITNTCVYEPQVSAVCEIGILTAIGNGNYACVYTPEAITNCPTGTTYDIVLDKCVSYPDVSEECPTGTTYNPATGLCEGELQITCVQGTYDPDRFACVYSPNMEYLCINGELTYVDDVPQCLIIPESTIVCASGWTYNSETDMCERFPDYWAGVIPDVTKIPFKQLWEDNKILILIIGGALLFFIIISGGRRR